MTKAVIFDLDGTILDSIGIWHEIDREFLAKRGLELPEDYARAVSVMHLHEAAEYTIRRFSLAERAEDIVEEWRQMAYVAYAEKVPMKRGAKEYLAALSERGVRLAVATALAADLANAALRRHGIYDWFETLVYAEDVGQGKSSPAVFLRVAENLKLLPSRCVVFEDTLAGIRSAKAAGMRVFGMADPAAAPDKAAIIAAADGYFETFFDVPTNI